MSSRAASTKDSRPFPFHVLPPAWSGTRDFTNSLTRTLNGFGRENLRMTEYDGLEGKLLKPHLDKSAIT
jgi:hypothetical protein